MKRIILISVLALGFSACKKTTNLEDVKKASKPTVVDLIIGGEVDPEGFIQSYSLFNGTNHQYSLYAYFKNHPDDQQCVDVGNLTANSNNVPLFNSENNNYKLSLVSGTASTNNWLNNLLNIDIAGNGNFATQTISHQNLDEFNSFVLNGVSGLNNNFNKSNPLTISWNAGNSTDKVYIELQFLLDSSNPNAPSSTIIESIAVPDNGSYVIPSSFFNPLPLNSLCLLSIYRGNYENYTASNGKHIGVLTYSKATSKIHLQ